MNTCTVPTCTVKTFPQGPWFLVTLNVEIPHGLLKKDHSEFSFDREFAGLSVCGIPLSVKGSTGPAAIGCIPLFKEKPAGWWALPHFAKAGLVVVTAAPRLAFVGMQKVDGGDRHTTLCIHPHDLAPIVRIAPQKTYPGATDLRIDELTSSLVQVLAQHAQQLTVVLLEKEFAPDSGTFIRVPNSLRLSQADWAAFKRHLFTGNSCGILADTTPIYNSGSCFNLPGRFLNEVQSRWGVGESKPSAYDGKHLRFTSLNVLQAAKLSRLFPNANYLDGRRLEISRFEYNGQYYKVHLDEAHAAGIVPAEGVLPVDSEMQNIYLLKEALRVDHFRKPVVVPVSYNEAPAVACPENLVAQFLVSARLAVRSYVIPSTVPSYRIRTQSAARPSDADPPGTYYLLADLRNLARRDLKQELAGRRACDKRLVERYGSDLPKGYKKFTEEQIELYFRIQDLLRTGEIIEAEGHPLLPGEFKTGVMVEWLLKAAPSLVMICPITEQAYVLRLNGMEDLVAIPGFWEAVESSFGTGTWLRKLVTCPEAQEAALISAI